MDNDYSTMDRWVSEAVTERIMPQLLDVVSEMSGELMGRITVNPGDESGIDAGLNIIRRKIFDEIHRQIIAEKKWKIGTVHKTR